MKVSVWLALESSWKHISGCVNKGVSEKISPSREDPWYHGLGTHLGHRWHHSMGQTRALIKRSWALTFIVSAFWLQMQCEHWLPLLLPCPICCDRLHHQNLSQNTSKLSVICLAFCHSNVKINWWQKHTLISLSITMTCVDKKPKLCFRALPW